MSHPHGPRAPPTGITQESFDKQYAKKTGAVLAEVMGVSASDVRFDPTKNTKTPAADLQPAADNATVTEKAAVQPQAKPKPPLVPVVKPKPTPEKPKEDPAVADVAAKAAADAAQAEAAAEGTEAKFTTGEGEC
jgi:hypothetical protein